MAIPPVQKQIIPPGRQNYKYDFLSFTGNNSVKSDCGDITFYNNGLDNVTINNSLVIFPGGFITLPCNVSEIDRTIYSFKFNTLTPTQSLVVIRKVYI